ncbi:leucine-rich repeat flightless-interacting protein 2 isoform X2 [Agrilus planipennis]|uniref:Leucine-rich repeat flightless-interacting protein 2 isoform X2 n=1 Tax=Agrilus planipennis TaxID=224129 RepID=A0A1W4XHL5_AGRPL|nr:leucine-rich repeat flightless-interacting protein 2 isoform X2 [Agrilus planipennis]
MCDDDCNINRKLTKPKDDSDSCCGLSGSHGSLDSLVDILNSLDSDEEITDQHAQKIEKVGSENLIRSEKEGASSARETITDNKEEGSCDKRNYLLEVVRNCSSEEGGLMRDHKTQGEQEMDYEPTKLESEETKGDFPVSREEAVPASGEEVVPSSYITVPTEEEVQTSVVTNGDLLQQCEGVISVNENAIGKFDIGGVTEDESNEDNKESNKQFKIDGVTKDESNDNINDLDKSGEKFKIGGVTEDETCDHFVSVKRSRKGSHGSEYEGRDSPVQRKLSRSHSVVSDHDDSIIISQYLGQSSDEAEARLLARRQARAEAREIRMRELERQQKEQEENADRQYDMIEASSRSTRTVGSRYLSSRRSSEDSLEDGGSLRELRHELKELEEKFRKAMIANAQLDNEKAAQTYQLELLKDRIEEIEDELSRLKREHKDKCREHDQLKRLSARLKDDLAVTRSELEERDRLIAEKGLVIVIEEEPPLMDGTVNGEIVTTAKKVLVTAENAQLLESAGEGSLDVRLGKFVAEKKDLQDQINHLRLELEEERNKRRKSSGISNGPTSDDYDLDDVQRDVVRQLADFKFRAQKAEQDVATLQATVARLESQVIRYKSAAEMYEKSEEALKQEKRKLQREENGNFWNNNSDIDDSEGERSSE